MKIAKCFKCGRSPVVKDSDEYFYASQAGKLYCAPCIDKDPEDVELYIKYHVTPVE